MVMKITHLEVFEDEESPLAERMKTYIRGDEYCHLIGDELRIKNGAVFEALDAVRLAQKAIDDSREDEEAAQDKLIALLEEIPEFDSAKRLSVSGERAFGSEERPAEIVGEVRRDERWIWSTQKLDDIFHTSEQVPPKVVKKLMIERKVFNEMPDSLKNVLRSALTIHKQKTKVNIK